MAKRRSVPEDLMGTILSESFEAAGGTGASPGSRGTPGDVAWDERPERVGVTFNLSKGLCAELEGLRRELRPGDDARLSRSEIAEVALRMAVEGVREGGRESELARRLGERRAAQSPDVPRGRTRRSVDGSGWIFETTLDENGAVVDEDVVGTVADLPVIDEHVDGQGRLVSVARDELGNTYERVMDEALNTLGARLLEPQNEEAR